MPKTVINVLLILITIALISWSVYIAIKGGRHEEATYLLLWALAVHVIIRPYVA